MITELSVKSAKPREKAYRLRDDRGLYLRVDPSGRKYWILRYWEQGKERQLSLGPYPDLSLKEAREKRDLIQNARARGESPQPKAAAAASPSLRSVTEEWLKVRMSAKAPEYLRVIRIRLKKYLLPALGSRPIDQITSADVLRLCRRIENMGHIDTAHRVKVLAGQIFRYAIATGRADGDPTSALANALTPQNVRHFATLTDPSAIGRLYAVMKAYPFPVMRAAMLFSILTFARPGEVRQAEWKEIKDGLWDIPAEKMKMKRRHLVPLSSQARKVLDGLREVTGEGRYLFPSPRGGGKCLSPDGVRVTLRSLGFSRDDVTPHGFRAMASTILNEHGFNRDVIERQLAHVEKDSVRRAYNHAEYLEERVRLMQWWGDWLEEVGSGGA